MFARHFATYLVDQTDDLLLAGGQTDRQHGVSAAEDSQAPSPMTYQCVVRLLNGFRIQRCRKLVNRADTPGADGTTDECHTCHLPLWAPSTHHCPQLPLTPSLGDLTSLPPSLLAFTCI